MILDPYTWRRLPIERIEHLTDDTVTVRLPRPADYSFTAGQYAIIRVNVRGTPLLRQYSFASAPSDDYIELLIQRELGGEVTNWFHESATHGDMSLELSQPFGSFTTQGVPGPLLLIAGRVGIAPFISIVREHLSQDTERAVSILYSVREPAQICHRELLDTLSTRYFLTDSDARISAQTLGEHLTPDTTAYICGSKRFVDGISELLTSLDVPLSRIKRERFSLQ